MTSGDFSPIDDPQDRDGGYIEAELVQEPDRGRILRPPPTHGRLPGISLRTRRKKLPLALFVITCFSTFWAGVTGWLPGHYLTLALLQHDAMPMRRAILAHWQDGLIYAACLLSILLMHEMGHFLVALRCRIPASLPYFLPFPVSPIGTMGAVIGMAGMRADRKEIFDIGLAGPLAGLVVAVPIMWIGIQQLDLTSPCHGPFKLGPPLGVQLVLEHLGAGGCDASDGVWYSQLNPYYMAGWVGLLITGLNMLPVSQLDGGHVIYALFGRRAHWLARAFMILAVAYIVYNQDWGWSLMILLVLLLGTDHPPTRDDHVHLGWFRTILGLASLAIPLLCFPLTPFKLVN